MIVRDKQAEDERIAQEKRENGQGPPRIKVVQEDYFVKKPAVVKRGAGVTAKQVAPAPPKKQKTEPSKKERIEKVEVKSSVLPVVKAVKTLSKNQKRELQKEAQFDSLVSKYKKMIDIQ